MAAVIANLAASVAGSTPRRGCCAAPAATRHASAPGLHRRPRPVRRLQHLDRAAGARARQCAAWPRARRSNSSASAARATISCAGSMPSQIVELVDLRSVRSLRFDNAEQIAEKIIALFRQGRIRRLHAVLLPLPLGDRQIPTAQQMIPPVFDAKTADALERRGLRIRAGRGGHPRTSFCRAISPCRSSARCSKTPRRSTARRWRRWTTPPATPAT